MGNQKQFSCRNSKRCSINFIKVTGMNMKCCPFSRITNISKEHLNNNQLYVQENRFSSYSIIELINNFKNCKSCNLQFSSLNMQIDNVARLLRFYGIIKRNIFHLLMVSVATEIKRYQYMKYWNKEILKILDYIRFL